MDTGTATGWTLDELCHLANQALEVDYTGSANGQVRDRPDARTIRYYTTLGLLDRPAGFRGRTALYGRRHLLQLVAVKRLQAEGLALRAVQERLLGLSPRSLEALARVPADLESPASEPASPATGRKAFWKESPATPPPVPVAAVPPALVQGVPLAEGITLLLSSPAPLTPEELPALHKAAAPLLRFLHSRRPSDPR